MFTPEHLSTMQPAGPWKKWLQDKAGSSILSTGFQCLANWFIIPMDRATATFVVPPIAMILGLLLLLIVEEWHEIVATFSMACRKKGRRHQGDMTTQNPAQVRAQTPLIGQQRSRVADLQLGKKKSQED